MTAFITKPTDMDKMGTKLVRATSYPRIGLVTLILASLEHFPKESLHWNRFDDNSIVDAFVTLTAFIIRSLILKIGGVVEVTAKLTY